MLSAVSYGVMFGVRLLEVLTDLDIPVNYSWSVYQTDLASQDLVTMSFGMYSLIVSLSKGKLFHNIFLVQPCLCPFFPMFMVLLHDGFYCWTS